MPYLKVVIDTADIVFSNTVFRIFPIAVLLAVIDECIFILSKYKRSIAQGSHLQLPSA